MSETTPLHESQALAGRGVIVVIPTYNEVENAVDIVERVLEELPQANVIIVDDNSPDGTAEAVEDFARRSGTGNHVRVLRREHKEGLGAAYRAGFAEALACGAKICVQMDADLSHDPKYLPEIVAAVALGADVSIGSRYTPGGRIENWPRLRRTLSRWGNRFAAGMLGLAVNDSTSGFRAYSAGTLDKMRFSTVTADGYGFQVEMTHRAVRSGARIVEIPILFTDRVRGQSKLTHHIIGEAFGLVVSLWFRERILERGYRS